MEDLVYVFSVTINFGEAFRNRNIYAKMLFVKQKNLQNLRKNNSVFSQVYP